MKADREIKKHLLAQLEMEPGVNKENIKASVKNSIVTLQGSVSSYAEKVAAVKAVERLNGVTGFVNDVVVELPSSQQRTDAEITDAATNAINCITTVPTETIKIAARDGWLILKGTLESCHEKEAAEDAVHHLIGIVGVSNLITINSALQTAAEGPFQASGRSDAEHVACPAEGETLITLPPLENCEVTRLNVPLTLPALLPETAPNHV